MNLLYTILVIVRVVMLTDAEILRMFCRHGGSLLSRGHGQTLMKS